MNNRALAAFPNDENGGAITRRMLHVAEQYAERDALEHEWGLSFTHGLEEHGIEQRDIPVTCAVKTRKGSELRTKIIRADALYGATWHAFMRARPAIEHRINRDCSIIGTWEDATLEYCEYLINKEQYPPVLKEENQWLFQICARAVIQRIMEAKWELEQKQLRAGEGSGYGFAYTFVYHEFDLMMKMRQLEKAGARGAHGSFRHMKESASAEEHADHVTAGNASTDQVREVMSELLRSRVSSLTYLPLDRLPLGAPRIRLMIPQRWVPVALLGETNHE